MKRVCMLLLCLTLCLGPVQSLGQGTDAGYLQGYLTDLSQGENLDALYACLDATMQAALSREDFSSLWGQLAAISGEFLGFDGDTESTAMGEYLVLTQRLDMSGMDLMCTMSLDASGKVAGLQFTPAPATADETAPSAGVTEEAIQVGEAPWELPGLLTLPENAQGPLPAVVLVQGSGPSDRNESVGAVKPFYDLAQALAAQGIAVVRYDKRTYVYGEEIASSASYSSFTVEEETIQDAIAAGELLAGDPRIDPDRIYLLGHSLGAMLAPRIVQESGELFAGMILACGSNDSLMDIMIRQNQDVINALADEETREAAQAQLDAECAKAEGLAALSAEEAQQSTLFGQPAYYFWEMAQHPTPAELLQKLEKPVLLINGDRDFQVTVAEGRESWEEALDLSAPWVSHLWVDVNHLLMRPEAPEEVKGTSAEYMIPCAVDAEVTDAIGAFIHAEKEKNP